MLPPIFARRNYISNGTKFI
uniref:Uncharacterized protein n=1 Tax=Arundo donax TaxID=35708 RepID=A0A0A8YDL1_ARUDO